MFQPSPGPICGLHNIFSISITPYAVHGILILGNSDVTLTDDKLLILSLNGAIELVMGGIMLQHVDHVVEVNEGVTDGNNLHFAGVYSSPDDQAPNMAKSVYSDLRYCVSEILLALHEMM